MWRPARSAIISIITTIIVIIITIIIITGQPSLHQPPGAPTTVQSGARCVCVVCVCISVSVCVTSLSLSWHLAQTNPPRRLCRPSCCPCKYSVSPIFLPCFNPVPTLFQPWNSPVTAL
jgi:hypothetical protein